MMKLHELIYERGSEVMFAYCYTMLWERWYNKKKNPCLIVNTAQFSESRFLSVICSVIKKFHKNVSPGVCCCCKKSKFRPRKEVLTTISCWHAGKACFPFNSFLHRFLLWLKFSQLCSKAYCFNICFLILLMFSKLVVL